MKVLNPAQLEQLLPMLETAFPRSLSMYHMVRNTLRQRFAWPGLQFVVDEFPNTSVCICRPEKDAKDSVPFMNGYTVFVYYKDVEAFRKMLFNEPNTLDWSQNILFADLFEPDQLVLVEEQRTFRGGHFDHLSSHEGFPTGECAYSFDLANLDLAFKIPSGFRLGNLDPEHAEQITQDRNYGHPANNAKCFRYMLEHNFPSAALFTNGSNAPIAYCLYKPEGTVGAAYVHPDYRKRGFYQLVMRALLKELRHNGEVNVWAQARKFNRPSCAGIEAVGAKKYEGETCHWINYWPVGHP